MDIPPAAGFRFHPSDEDLINVFLKAKINNVKLPPSVPISNCDLYKAHPSHVYDISKDKWQPTKEGHLEGYFFVSPEPSTNDKRFTRVVEGQGTWEGKAKVTRFVLSGQEIGLKKQLKFDEKDPAARLSKGFKWIMHEYSIEGNMKDVLCRIIRRLDKKKNNVNWVKKPLIDFSSLFACTSHETKRRRIDYSSPNACAANITNSSCNHVVQCTLPSPQVECAYDAAGGELKFAENELFNEAELFWSSSPNQDDNIDDNDYDFQDLLPLPNVGSLLDDKELFSAKELAGNMNHHDDNNVVECALPSPPVESVDVAANGELNFSENELVTGAKVLGISSSHKDDNDEDNDYGVDDLSPLPDIGSLLDDKELFSAKELAGNMNDQDDDYLARPLACPMDDLDEIWSFICTLHTRKDDAFYHH